MKPGAIRQFFQLEAASGVLLLFAAALALALANSRLAGDYEALLHAPRVFSAFGLHFSMAFRVFIDDGLMTLFFLLIGLELKQEWAAGKLSLSKKMILPGSAALGGMVVPALIYGLVSFSHGNAAHGWAVPMATDIAFSLGVLSLFGKRAPAGLKVFLMLLAILDDAGAVLVIAVFYSAELSWLALLLMVSVMALLVLLGRFRVTHLLPWILGGLLLWLCLWSSGIHPVLAGVLLAMVMPAKGANHPVGRLVTGLHPWVAFGIMPLFALVNAGVSFKGYVADMSLAAGVVPAIVAGLVIGKPVGITGVAWLLVRGGVARLPTEVNWRIFWGVAFLCGIGFTMSLFIGTLAFENLDPVYTIAVRQGVLLGSCLSGVAGAVILGLTLKTRDRRAS